MARETRKKDPEVEAMEKIGRAIDGIQDAEARKRVLAWIQAKYGRED